MNVLEKLISLIAPHKCLICGISGAVICQFCIDMELQTAYSRCYRCHRLTRQSTVCRSCRSSVSLHHVWVAANYDELSKKILYQLKFNRARAAGATIAQIISRTLPDLPNDIIVTHIPTASNRIRVRGYDQAHLIAVELAKIRSWRYDSLLLRVSKSRQLGAGRQERFKHLEQALVARKKKYPDYQHILLIDDVTTSGATIEAAAKQLKQAGARTIDAAVFAQP